MNSTFTEAFYYLLEFFPIAWSFGAGSCSQLERGRRKTKNNPFKKDCTCKLHMWCYFKPARAGFVGGGHIYPREHVIEENQVF